MELKTVKYNSSDTMSIRHVSSLGSTPHIEVSAQSRPPAHPMRYSRFSPNFRVINHPPLRGLNKK